MSHLELEKTYLAKDLPANLDQFPCKNIWDKYIDVSLHHHSKIRLRKTDDTFELTKKIVLQAGDNSCQKEDTLHLTLAEYKIFNQLHGKTVHKKRYNYPYQNMIAEIDVFQDNLKGLVLIDFEFENEHAKQSFIMPPFCLADVTQENSVAGNRLCGKKYHDIEHFLTNFNYSPLYE